MAEPLPSEEVIDEAGSLTSGMRLGRYELLVAIARGGMARVWAARQHGQRGFTKLVAIKTILPHLAMEPEFERMFLDEARIASNVHHPNVCEIYELGDEEGVLYLAMEWVNGDSLARVLRPNGPQTLPMDPRVVARILADGCAGLHAAHQLVGDDGRPMQVVHRDFSPHNILLSAEGNVKVADFGVAKALNQLHEHTSAGQLKGKLAYMAPEQIGGVADRRSDVFSAGCILYEATIGYAPFRGDNDLQLMQALMQGAYVRPAHCVRGYPSELEAIVMTALAPDPDERFQTAEDLRIALEEWLAHSGAVVTQANVAHSLKARVGERIERRKERIRSAQLATSAERDLDAVNMTPSGRGVPRGTSSASGVKQMALVGQVQLGGQYMPPGRVPPDLSNPYMAHPSQLSQLSQFAPPSQLGPPTSFVPPVQQEEGGGVFHYVGAAAIGVVAALFLGGGGYLVWQRTNAGPRVPITQAPVTAAPPVTTAPPTTAAPITGVPVTAAPPITGVPVTAAPPITGAPVTAAPPVTGAPTIEPPDGPGKPPAGSVAPPLVLEPNPPTATVSVDGAPATTLSSLPRPAPGKTQTLTFKAEGRDDLVVKVDETTPSPLKVVLRWKARPSGPVAPAIPKNPY